MTKLTDIPQFISDLDAGIIEEQFSRVISDAAAAVINISEHRPKVSAKVSLDLTFNRNGNGANQVLVAAKLNYKIPKMHGSVSEDRTKVIPMYVNEGGRVTLFPDNQNDMFPLAGKNNVENES
ncbi:MAG: hypothetical protein N0E44_18015 [Candidatus Thiodiazotropha lotti]|nr:hypothetical protein [Candidatus Thiodiazotropha lotti]MCW4221780.1 hypothetical protein [Candidatus Thiodiazotropha lotti]